MIEIEIVEINEIFTQKRQRAQSNFQRDETMTIKHDEIKTRDREIQNFDIQYEIEKKCDLKASQMQIDYAMTTQLQKQKNEISLIFHDDLKIFFDIFNDESCILNSQFVICFKKRRIKIVASRNAKKISIFFMQIIFIFSKFEFDKIFKIELFELYYNDYEIIESTTKQKIDEIDFNNFFKKIIEKKLKL